MTDPKPPRWRALRLNNGFALRLITDGDFGEALISPDALSSSVVEIRERTLPLYDALLELINGRISGLIVLTEQVEVGRSVGQHQAMRSRGVQ